jgi:phage shock protein PspC (stress-responsive transcriptional regulator)
MNQRHLYRSANDRVFSGVAGGVADYFEVDPVLVRILWFISIPFTGGLTFLAYIVMMIVVPVEPEEWPQPSPWAPGGDPTGFQAGYAPPEASAAGLAAEGATGGTPAGSADPATPSAAAGAMPGATPGTAPFSAQASPTDWRSQRRQERWQYRRESHGTGAIAFGLLLIILGGAFAWNQIDPRLNLSLAWPIAVIAVGAILVLSAVGRSRHD